MTKGMELVINSYLRLMRNPEKHDINLKTFLFTDGDNNLVVTENPNYISYNGNMVYSEGELSE